MFYKHLLNMISCKCIYEVTSDLNGFKRVSDLNCRECSKNKNDIDNTIYYRCSNYLVYHTCTLL